MSGNKKKNLFKAGESGNKVGRPPGRKNNTTLLAEAVKSNAMDVVLQHFPKLIEVAVTKAQEGDAKFAKMLLDRIWPVEAPGMPAKGGVTVSISVNALPEGNTNARIIDSSTVVVSATKDEDNGEDDEIESED